MGCYTTSLTYLILWARSCLLWLHGTAAVFVECARSLALPPLCINRVWMHEHFLWKLTSEFVFNPDAMHIQNFFFSWSLVSEENILDWCSHQPAAVYNSMNSKILQQKWGTEKRSPAASVTWFCSLLRIPRCFSGQNYRQDGLCPWWRFPNASCYYIVFIFFRALLNLMYLG